MRFQIVKLEERIAPSTIAFLGTKAHHNTVYVDGDNWGDVIAFLGTKAHHNTIYVSADCFDEVIAFLGTKAHHNTVSIV